MVAVTIGLPFFNSHESLGEAIRSVFAQTFEDWELLLVDDGSTDGSLDVARRVRDARIRVLADGENRALPARLNQIVDTARGDLIARLDSDDMMHPERLARQVRLLAQQPSIDLVGTACFTLDERCKVIGVLASEPVRSDPYHVLRRGLLPHATLVCRRAWCRANRYDERFPRAEDRELFCRTLATVRFAQIRDPLYFVGYRKNGARMLADYVATSRDNRRLFAKYAPGIAGPFSVAPLLLESLGKEAIFRAVTALGRQDLLIRRRGRPASELEHKQAQHALVDIRGTRVPGLDS